MTLGSLGDLGTLLPLLIALSTQRSIQLAPALFFGGVSNVITGLVWDVPMCVQPMKSISAVALSENWTSGSVTAAGVITGGAVFLLGITGFVDLVNRIVPSNVVSGLQIGVGVRLASKGIKMVAELGWIDSYDCIVLGILCSILCLFWLADSDPSSTRHDKKDNDDRRTDVVSTSRIRNIFSCCYKPFRLFSGEKHPVGIYLFAIGAIFASVALAITKNENDHYDLPLQFFGAPVAFWAMGDVTSEDYWIGFVEGTIPQLPLTTLNSVISVCALAHSLYPEKRMRNSSPTSNDTVISRKDVAISVGLMNLLFCPFGSMPNCHGAGGLAGQHRLGARHGASVVFLGVWKILLAIFLGKSALTLLDAFPKSILGIMLTIAGQELATTGFTFLVKSVEDSIKDYDEEEQNMTIDVAKVKSHRLRQNTVIAAITAIVIITLGKTHYGALSGWVAHMTYGGGLLELFEWYQSYRNPKIEYTTPTYPEENESQTDELEESSPHQ